MSTSYSDQPSSRPLVYPFNVVNLIVHELGDIVNELFLDHKEGRHCRW